MAKIKKETNVKQVARCRHCGGPLREYRNGISCLMCGREVDHSCERCRYAEEEFLKKKVA